MAAFTPHDRAALAHELAELLAKMDVPSYRRDNVAWIQRNLAKKNAAAPGFVRAMEIVEAFMSYGIAHL